ncbi:hypothetical protein G7Z17_g6422 [Cylindrodendrum hubeiense]|uniref:Uncharacterized protein n=1 Tax=Cylindrodendrum hubeiense TaxID=595255 RepID=A0A9P5LGU8_9HYPO|nr:hypothetical protein G7Z17_g6422 [Cylindrodendrum hubeiense]
MAKKVAIKEPPPPTGSKCSVVQASRQNQRPTALDDYNERKNGKPPNFGGRYCRSQPPPSPPQQCKLDSPNENHQSALRAM